MSLRLLRAIIIASFLSVVFYSNSFSQSKLDSIQVLDEVVVVRQQIPTEIVPVQTLSGEVLEKLNAHSVADALRYFSGVQLKDYGGIGGLKTINVRSMGSQHVGVFYDGIEIGNPQNGVVDLGRYSLDNMESLSLYNGQKSVIFQPAKDFASASSIYMTTKAPVFSSRKPFNIKGTFKGGSFDLVNPSVLWEQKISSDISSSFNADYTYSSGKYKFSRRRVYNDVVLYDTTMTRRNGDIRYLRLEHALFGKIADGDWKTRLYYYDSERGYPGFIDKNPSNLKFEDRQWDQNFFFQSSLKKKISSRYSTLFSAKYAYDNIHYISGLHPGPFVDNKYKLHELYLSSANIYNLTSFWNINLSADYMWNKMNSDMKDFIYPVRHSGWVALATSLYLYKVKAQASILGTIVSESLLHNSYSENGAYLGAKKMNNDINKYTPSLILSYQPWSAEDLHFRAFYKDIFRMPTFSEMHLVFMSGTSSILKPERAKQYNVGLTYSKNVTHNLNLGIQTDAYYNDVTDKLVSVPGGANFRWTMMNLGSVKIRGVDVALTGSLKPNKNLSFDLRLNYAYQQARDYTWEVESDSTKYKGQIAYIPKHSGSSVLSISYKEWNLNHSFIYTGERYTHSDNDADDFVPAWYTHDLSLSRNFKWQKTAVKLTAEINNLFNQQYDIVDNYPMPGTNMKFIVSVTY